MFLNVKCGGGGASYCACARSCHPCPPGDVLNCTSKPTHTHAQTVVVFYLNISVVVVTLKFKSTRDKFHVLSLVIFSQCMAQSFFFSMFFFSSYTSSLNIWPYKSVAVSLPICVCLCISYAICMHAYVKQLCHAGYLFLSSTIPPHALCWI